MAQLADMHRINRLIQICLDIADYYDKKARDSYRDDMLDDIGLGVRSLPSYLREGAKAIITMQTDYYRTEEMALYYKEQYEAQKAFMSDIFGDDEAENLYDEDKAKIKAFVKTLFEDISDETNESTKG